MTSLEAIYFFRHAAVRDVVYSLHLPSTRAELHRTALDSLEQEFAGRTEFVSGELAEHARLGRDGLTGEEERRLAQAEYQYLCQSVKRLSERAQWDQVVLAAERALRTGCGTIIEHCEIRLKQTEALGWLGRRADLRVCASDLERLGRESGDVKYELGGLALGANNLTNMGELAQAETMLVRASTLADARGGCELRAKTRMDLGLLCSARGEHEKQEALSLEALQILGDVKAHIRWPIRGNLANLYSGTGRIDESIGILQEITKEFSSEERATVLDKHMLATAQVNLARQYLLQGRLESAEQLFLEGISTSTAIGKGTTAAFALANLAEVDLLRGNFERAQASILAAIDGALEHGLPMYHAAYSCTLAELHLLRGHEAQAQELVENARSEFAAVGGEAYVAEYCGIARLRVAASRAASFPVQGRATSRLRATAPSGSWLPVMRELAAQITQSRDSRGGRASAPLDAAALDATALVAEFELALKENRPAMVFRGHLPARMRADLRQSLVQRMNPAEAQMLQRLHPELWDAMNAS